VTVLARGGGPPPPPPPYGCFAKLVACEAFTAN
jgi:hypothetical protein